MEKIYYQLLLTQKSPLRIGNAHSESSDSDLMLDGRGLPFIPGTSLAGVIRHIADKICKDDEILNDLFGNVIEATEEKYSSRVLIGDAILGREVTKETIRIDKRDGVGLGEWETVEQKAKFDFQIAESKQPFCSVIEWTGDETKKQKEITEIIEPIMQHLAAAGIQLGARTSRGYGDFLVEIRQMSFVFPKDLDRWLQFKPYERNVFDRANVITGKRMDFFTEIRIDFVMTGSFSVRVNTAKTEIAEDGSVSDSIPLINHAGNPVIPGTAWAGVFRHHMHHLLRDVGVLEESQEMKEIDLKFGKAVLGKDNQKSGISFSETEIVDGKMESVVRTAIDRFTSMPRNAALFTGRVCTGGKGFLYIRYDKDSIKSDIKELLAACICDMHMGLVTVGGEASVGRGIMQITDVLVNGRSRFLQMEQSCHEGGKLDWLKENIGNE